MTRKSHPAIDSSLFAWPIIDAAAEAAILELLHKPGFRDAETVIKLETRMAQWLGRRFALSQSSGTAALEVAMFACGIGPGTEIVGPSLAYWACVQPAAKLGATIVLADILPETLTIDIEQVEALITPRTRAVVAVDAQSRVGDMARLVALCRDRGVALIEDASHSVGAQYYGTRAGRLSDVAVFSMSGKVFAAGEGGMLVTDDQKIFERAIAWGMHHRFDRTISDPALRLFAGLPIGATTSRITNLSAALALAQLEAIDQRMAEIDLAMTLFSDGLDRLQGLRVNRAPATAGAGAMGVWHDVVAFYTPAHDGPSIDQLVMALQASGLPVDRLRAQRKPLHCHRWFRSGSVDPLLAPFKPRVRCPLPLPVAETIDAILLPRFTFFRPNAIAAAIESFAEALTTKRRDPKRNVV